MSLYISLLVNGVAMGLVYAILAMGLILLIRAVGILNFAQGDLMMFGAYISASMLLDFKLPLYILLPLSVVFFALIGIIFMFSIYWPLRKASYPAATIIATMGASIVFKEAASLIWGSQPRTVPALVLTDKGKTAVLTIGNVTLQWQYIIIIVVGSIMIFLITQLFEKLYAGKMMQAACQDSYAANLLGVPSILTICLTYMIVTCTAGICGYLVAPIFMVRTTLEISSPRVCRRRHRRLRKYQGRGDRLNHCRSCESFSTMWFSGYKDVTVFLLLIIFLVFQPQGIFGERTGDKA